MGTCFIVGAGDFTPRGFTPGPEDLIIAADGGYLALRAVGVTPHLLLGDFDSLGSLEKLPANLPVQRHPDQKDETDMGIALAEGWERGCRDFAIYGGGGGRVDHLLANIQCMCRYSRLGGRLRLVDQSYEIFTLTNGTLTLPARPTGTLVSVFCHGETARGVTLRGLMYPLTNATLTCDYPLGVSNQTLSDVTPAEVSVQRGTVYIMVY